MSPARILFFLKEPRPGAVKTRLAREVGDQAAADLYRAMAEDTLEVLHSLQVPVPITVCFAPASAREAVLSWLGPGLDYAAQAGQGLGARMLAAFEQAFAQGAGRAVLVGSDLPDLPAGHLALALDWLSTGPAPVFGPAPDGGYYLAGFTPQSLTPAAFADIPMSRPDTLARTLAALSAQGLQARLLPEHADLDTLEDLHRLRASPGARRLRAVLERLGR